MEYNTNGIKLYSQRAIFLSTFLGAPMAAGYLVSVNLRNLGRYKAAKIDFIITQK